MKGSMHGIRGHNKAPKAADKPKAPKKGKKSAPAAKPKSTKES